MPPLAPLLLPSPIFRWPLVEWPLARWLPAPAGPIRVETLITYGAVLLALLVLWAVARRLLARRRRRGGPTTPELRIDVARLETGGPPPGETRLEFFHTPVRLAVVVLAPAGRAHQLPDEADLPRLVEELLPGLMDVMARDRPLFRRWPAQLSSQGFTQAFFNHVALPGDRGKGTPWCSIAGRFDSTDGPYLAGLVCCAEKRNQLSQIGVTVAGGWLDALRVKRE